MSTEISRKHAPLLLICDALPQDTRGVVENDAAEAVEQQSSRNDFKRSKSRPHVGMGALTFFSNLLSEINVINLDLNVQIAYIKGKLLERESPVPVRPC